MGQGGVEWIKQNGNCISIKVEESNWKRERSVNKANCIKRIMMSKYKK